MFTPDILLSIGICRRRICCCGSVAKGLLSKAAPKAFAQGKEEQIAEAMLTAAREAGVEGRTKITKPSLKGAHIDRD